MKTENLKFRTKNERRKTKSFLESSSHFPVPSPRFTEGGFTLIETVMIIVIVAIAIPALLIILGQGAKQSVDAELETAATYTAQALMEEIRSKGFTAASAYNGYSDTVPVGGVQYTRAAQVCFVNSGALDTCIGGPTDYKRIQVTVTNPTIGSSNIVTVVTNY